MEENRLFPIFLKFEQLKILLVGGGNVGLEKLSAILSNSPGSEVHLVAGNIKNEIVVLAGQYPNLHLYQKDFDWEDLDGKDIVFLATDNRKLHEKIRNVCKIKHLLVNVADTPDLCDFYLSSIVQKGDLKIAISTNGKSPTVAKRLKEFLNELIPNDIQSVLNRMNAVRNEVVGDFKKKVAVLDQITNDWLVTRKKN